MFVLFVLFGVLAPFVLFVLCVFVLSLVFVCVVLFGLFVVCVFRSGCLPVCLCVCAFLRTFTPMRQPPAMPTSQPLTSTRFCSLVYCFPPFSYLPRPHRCGPPPASAAAALPPAASSFPPLPWSSRWRPLFLSARPRLRRSLLRRGWPPCPLPPPVCADACVGSCDALVHPSARRGSCAAALPPFPGAVSHLRAVDAQVVLCRRWASFPVVVG